VARTRLLEQLIAQAGLALDSSGRNGSGKIDALAVGEVANRVNSAGSRGDGQVSMRFLPFSQCFVPLATLALDST